VPAVIGDLAHPFLPELAAFYNAEAAVPQGM
jgi:hypothetical protein